MATTEVTKGRLMMLKLVAIVILVLMLFSACAQDITPPSQAETEAEAAFAQAREKMVEQLIDTWDISDPRVIEAMEKVPRHRFVLPEYLDDAYEDTALPIEHGQTISSPSIVATMTQQLALKPGDKVLEIGTGSGYQAAVLAELTDRVYSIEIIEPLGLKAKALLEELGYKVQTKIDDGYYGWAEHAPFDAIIVTAAPYHIPPPLLSQLKDGGRIVIPVGGPPGFYQTLWLVEKSGDQIKSTNLGPVRFVPLLGEH